MPSRQPVRPSTKDMILARPQDMPESEYRVWEQILADLNKEAQALPLGTLAALMMERIATIYVQIKRLDRASSQDWEYYRALNLMWLRVGHELADQVHKTRQTPEQRFVASFKAALNSAAREAGPDMTLREFMPKLAEALEEFDV